MEKHIVHCDLGTFFVSLERLLNKEGVGFHNNDERVYIGIAKTFSALKN